MLAILLGQEGVGSAYDSEEQPFWKVLEYNVRLHHLAAERERAQKSSPRHAHPALANHPALSR